MSPQAGHRPVPRHLTATLATLAALTLAAMGLTATPALAGTCPNEQLRVENNSTSLPQCRAYELVTNPFKEGFVPFQMVGTDGALQYQSGGNFAGDGLGSPDNWYAATRSSAGWLTESLNPSGPDFQVGVGGVQLVSQDPHSLLWLTHLSSEPATQENYYLRKPDGSFTLVGPAVNPAAQIDPPGISNGGSFLFTEAVSADLSHVVFSVAAPDAFPGPPPGFGDNLYEYVGTGNERPQLVGVDNAGTLINPLGTCSQGISADGRVAFFVPGCGNGQIWARINETTSIHASASECTRTAGDPGGACNGPGEVTAAGISSDGSRVFFTTTQQLVNGDTDQSSDLYECDIPPGTPAPVGLANPCASLTDITGSASGANVESVLRISPDGSHVYFIARGVLASNLDANGGAAAAGARNLYVWQQDAAHPAGQTSFIGALDSGPVFGTFTATTADGRYFLFSTSARLVASDTDEVADVYRYDSQTGALLRLSTDTSGTGGNTPGLEVRELGPIAMSADGSTVAFETNEALSPADTNGTRDVYEWHEGQVSLISSGRPSLEQATEQKYAAVSPSGDDIYFTTTAQLTPADIDTVPDVYDARLDGGFSFAKRPRCSGTACQGEQPAQPAPPGAAATATLSGPGSATPAEAPPANPPKPRPLTRAQKLAKALKTCRAKKNRKRRAACERQARRTYGSRS